MPEASAPRKRLILTSENFDRFLGYLDPNRHQAGEKYETIRRTLMTYFRYNGCVESEELVDETIDRVARKLDEARDLMPFIRGIARHVASEAHRRRKALPLDSLPEQVSQHSSGEQEADFDRRLQCLQQCLERLSVSDRELIVEYYKYEGAAKILNKQRLAAALKISLDALGVRAFRVRRQLRYCVDKCMECLVN